MKKRLLLNYVFYPNVGHVVEALKFSLGFYNSNNNLDVCVALNSDSPVELADTAHWIRKTYAINIDQIMEKGDDAGCLKNVPREWDYIVTGRHQEITRLSKGNKYERKLAFCLKLFDEKFHARIGSGIVHSPTILPAGLKYKKAILKIKIPKIALKFASRYNYSGLKICVLLAGNGKSNRYPSKGTWSDIFKAIKKEFPDSRIFITGVSKSINNRTYTRSFSKADVKALVDGQSDIVDCYNIGLWNQIALLHKCDMLIAPHSGFCFLAPCVGTPWLALSGGSWPEYFFNEFPFYSVLPEDENYPYLWAGSTIRGRRIPHYSRVNINKKIPEIINAIHLLLQKSFTFKKAMRLHQLKLHRLGKTDFKWVNPHSDFY